MKKTKNAALNAEDRGYVSGHADASKPFKTIVYPVQYRGGLLPCKLVQTRYYVFSTLLRAESPLESLFRPRVEKRIQRC